MSAPMMPSPRPLVPPSSTSASQLPAASLLGSKAPQPPVSIDLTAFHQLQQQFQSHQQRGPPHAVPLSAANSASASVTLSQPLTAWPGKAVDSQASNFSTLVQSFNRHASQGQPNYAPSVSFSSSSPPPQLHSLVPPNSHSINSSPNGDAPPSDLSYSTVYYPQSPPATALHTLSSSGYHQPASPLMSSGPYWFDPSSGQQQQYVLKMNNGNIVIPAPMAVAAQQPAQLLKPDGTAAVLEQAAQQPAPTPGRHSACAVCHSAKTSCNGQRPCDRCVRLDRQSMCVDRPRKTPVRSDKKKTKGDDSEPAADGKSKKVKRDQDNGTDDTAAASKRSRAEDGVEEDSGKPATEVKKQVTLVPPAAAASASTSTASTPAGPDSPSFRRELSSHSSHSSSDSTSTTTPSSPAVAVLDELADVASSSGSSEPERRLSVTYLKAHQMYPTRAAIADAIRNGAATPLQVHFMLSYLKAVLHQDDFKQLLQPLRPSSSLLSPNRALTSLPPELVDDRGTYIPRFTFNFGASPLEPVNDNVFGLIDFATLQIVRVDPPEDGNVSMNTAFGLPELAGDREKSTSPLPQPSAPAVPFATSSTSAFTAVPSATGPAASPSLPLPDSSSLASSSSSATASSPAASLLSPMPLSPSYVTPNVPMEDTATPSSNSTTSNASVASTSSSSSSSSSASPDSSSAVSLSVSPLSLSLSSPPSSSSSAPVPSSDSSSSVVPLPSSLTPSPISPFARGSGSEQLFLTVLVNREFERLFGYSQPFMRDLFRSEGGKVLYRLLATPSMPVLSKWFTEALIGERTEFKAVVTITNRYKGTTECLLNCRWTLDSGGLFRSVAYCFSPLPEKGSSIPGGGGRRMKGDV